MYVCSTTHTTTCRHGQALFSWQPRWQLLSDWVASPPLFIITDLASPPPLQPLLFLTFSDIYPPPQWQRPAHSHRPAWVSPCGLVCWMSWSTSETERERRGGQTAKRERERKQKAEHGVQSTSAAAVFYTSIYFHHKHNTQTHARTHIQIKAQAALMRRLFEFVCDHPLRPAAERKGHARREGRTDKERVEKQ